MKIVPATLLRSTTPGWRLGLRLTALAATLPATAAEPPDRELVETALIKAVTFYHGEVASHGGYVYRYSADLQLREAEGIPDRDTIWIQPPGTPAIGEAFLDAYEATGNPICSQAALAAARALVRSQLQSGGWHYRAHLSETGRDEFHYRRTLREQLLPDLVPEPKRTGAGGWLLWKRGDYRPQNQTILDDDVTQSALRFLMRIDRALEFQDANIHDAVATGLEALLGAQYPNGGWSANFDRFPATSPSVEVFPVKPANYPMSWSRTWPKAYDGSYVTNDNLMANVVATLVRATEIYGDQEPRYRESLVRAGEFLILAQMPEPQPAWAQQYNVEMQPTWDRQFEPPAISGRESQDILLALIAVARATGEPRFLDPVPRAIAYLEKSRLPNGKLARFYELETNRPLYFTRGRGGKGWVITYETGRLASNYGWEWESRLEEIEAAHRLAGAGASPPSPGAEEMGALQEEVVAILASQDSRGAWAVTGMMRNAEGRKTEPAGGIIESQVFINHVTALCRYLAVNR